MTIMTPKPWNTSEKTQGYDDDFVLIIVEVAHENVLVGRQSMHKYVLIS